MTLRASFPIKPLVPVDMQRLLKQFCPVLAVSILDPVF